jgi:predicted transcriptional regulator YdeE
VGFGEEVGQMATRYFYTNKIITEERHMNLRLEKKATFFVSGYSVVTSEETLEKDCKMLREKYENMLRSVSNHVYFISWANEDDGMVYHFGIEAQSKEPATENATCVEVPAACFAIATVPEGANILSTWHEFFDKGITSLNADINMDYSYYCESFAENGVCELWIPVIE